MISRRSKWFLIGASLAPLGLAFAFLADWFRQRWLRAAYPGWIIDAKAPWYILALVVMFYIGLLFAIGAIASILLDYRRRKGTDAQHS
jgi:succinate dehydrogenase hydrophobic anchor subunit